ncbi:MAG TPA: HlyD family efflux transporter periplasmic adaptor subunit [Terriglobales bacterium]|nr:HlyD family efflux transporter periplasmic adaptor subunit [Terriglobales bacterium]
MNTKKKRSAKTRRWMAIAGAAVLIAGGGAAYMKKREAAAAAGTVYNAAAVTKGDLTAVISSSGTVQPIEQYSVVSLATGDVLADNLSEGDEVAEGQVLYEIDRAEAERNIQKYEIALQKQQISNEQTQSSLQNQYVRATTSGVVTQLFVDEGDEVNSGTKLCEVTDYDTLTVTLPFNASDAAGISVGDAAAVWLEETGEQVDGTVTRVATGSYISDGGVPVSDVTVAFPNPGAVTSGAQVSVITGGYACNETGESELSACVTVTAKTSGTIEGLTVSKGDSVTAGRLLLTLDSDTAQVNGLSSALSLENAQLELQDMIDKLEDYTITAPISGTVMSKSYKAGDTLDGNKSTLCVIADMSALTFEMAIDELDIKELYVGQKVIVTADAVEGTEYEGQITAISIVGTTSSSVTTYPVTVVIEDYEGLLPGMNVTADIVSAEVKDALMVPVAAVTRGSLVRVDKSSVDEADIVQEDGDYAYVKVTTGISTDDYIEITGGLEEGQTVYISSASQTTETTNNMNMGMIGGMPTGGGTMPSGGFSGGGERPSGGGGGGGGTVVVRPGG